MRRIALRRPAPATGAGGSATAVRRAPPRSVEPDDECDAAPADRRRERPRRPRQAPRCAGADHRASLRRRRDRPGPLGGMRADRARRCGGRPARRSRPARSGRVALHRLDPPLDRRWARGRAPARPDARRLRGRVADLRILLGHPCRRRGGGRSGRGQSPRPRIRLRPAPRRDRRGRGPSVARRSRSSLGCARDPHRFGLGATARGAGAGGQFGPRRSGDRDPPRERAVLGHAISSGGRPRRTRRHADAQRRGGRGRGSGRGPCRGRGLCRRDPSLGETDPNARQRLAWRHGVGAELLEAGQRRREIANFLAHLSTLRHTFAGERDGVAR